MKKYLVYQTIDYIMHMSMTMNIRTVDPLLKHMHEFSLKIFYGGLSKVY
jgi:hypothetical protein